MTAEPMRRHHPATRIDEPLDDLEGSATTISAQQRTVGAAAIHTWRISEDSA